MKLQKFLLLGLPVLALAATTTTEEDEDEVATTTTKSSSSTFKTLATTTSSSSSDDEEEDTATTTTTSSKGSKSTSLSSSKSDNSTEEESSSSWKYKAFGEFISDLPECTRTCFETPISLNVTENCARVENWNCICHFYKPSFYEKVFNDTPPVTTTTSSRVTRKTSTATSTTTSETATATVEAVSEEELAQDDFFICLEDACGLKKWGAAREEFFDRIDALNSYCETEEAVYDEKRNKDDYQEIEDAKKALEAKKKAEEAKKNAAGKIGLGTWGFAATAIAGFAVAFAL